MSIIGTFTDKETDLQNQVFNRSILIPKSNVSNINVTGSGTTTFTIPLGVFGNKTPSHVIFQVGFVQIGTVSDLRYFRGRLTGTPDDANNILFGCSSDDTDQGLGKADGANVFILPWQTTFSFDILYFAGGGTVSLSFNVIGYQLT